MRPRPRFVLVALLVIVYVTLFAYRDITEQLAQGRAVPLDEVSAGAWQYGREALLFLLVALMVNGVAVHQRATTGKVRLPTSTALWGLYVAGVATVTLAVHGPTLVAYGSRYVAVAVLLTCLLHYTSEERRWLGHQLGRWLKPFLVIEAGLAWQQVTGAPPVFGVNFLGSRVWGSFPSPNNLGLAMLGVALVLVTGRPRRWPLWTAVTFAVALATGSRLAVLAILLTAALLLVYRSRGRVVSLIPIGVLGFAAYELVSEEAVSGRVLGQQETRLSVWADVLATMDSPMDLLIGVGMGVGSNVTVVAGQGESFTDSAVIGVLLSFGLVGLVGVVMWLARVIAASDPAGRFVVWPPVILAALAFNVIDVSPVNVLAVVAASLVAGGCHESTTTGSGAGQAASPRAVRS